MVDIRFIRFQPPCTMLQFDTTQMAAANQAHFFHRVAAFVCEQTPIAAYRDAAVDKPLRNALWAPHWPALREATEHDAALFMCFVLACATLRIDVARAATAIRQATQPEMSMKLFLSERGLLRFSSFDLPHLSRPDVPADVQLRAQP